MVARTRTTCPLAPLTAAAKPPRSSSSGSMPATGKTYCSPISTARSLNFCGERTDDLPFSTDDEISSAEDLEDHVKSVGTSFEAEDRDPIEALLLDRYQSSVIEQPP